MKSEVEEWTVLSMLEWTTDYFKQKGIPDPRHSIEWLLAETLDIKRLDLYLKYDRPLSQTGHASSTRQTTRQSRATAIHYWIL